MGRRTSRLEGQIAIVTGGGRGNGRAIACGFARERAKVSVVDLDERAASETAREIVQSGAEALAITGDVSNREDISRAIAATKAAFGGINILVNNAGIACRAPFLELSETQWDRVLQVNLKSAFLFSQGAAEEMKNAGRGGRIINITSILGEVARPNISGYATSKAALKMLTKAMAVDLAPYGIRVNAIAPGYVKTAMTDDVLRDEAVLEKLLERIPLGYIASPEDIVGPAIFLASDESKYVTGAILPVDGGWTAL